MAEQVTFGITQKRVNSISQQYAPIITTEVLFKEPCSITAPVFLVKQNFATIKQCNYAEYAGFYYYIDDVISVRKNHVMVHCHRDALASFAGHIRNAYGFATFADIVHCYEDLDDPRLTPDMLRINYTQEYPYENLFQWDIDDGGCFIVRGYRQKGTSSVGFVTYIMDKAEFLSVFRNIQESMLQDLTQHDVASILSKIGAKLWANGSVRDCIMDAYWIPIAKSIVISATGATLQNFALGGYESINVQVHATGRPYAAQNRTMNFIMPWSQFPIMSACKWLRLPKYSTIQIAHPGGALPVPMTELIDKDVLVCHLCVDVLNGSYELSAYADKKLLALGRFSCKLSMMSHTPSGLQSIDSKAFATGARILLTKLGGGTQSVTQTLTDMHWQPTGETDRHQYSTSTYHAPSGIIGEFMPPSQAVNAPYIATDSGLLGMVRQNKNIAITLTTAMPAILRDGVEDYDRWAAQYGYPCNMPLRAGDVNGYVQFAEVSAPIFGATVAEVSSINSYLNSGIYIEE